MMDIVNATRPKSSRGRPLIPQYCPASGSRVVLEQPPAVGLPKLFYNKAWLCRQNKGWVQNTLKYTNYEEFEWVLFLDM